MPAVPVSIAGPITLALIVGLGVFVYPWLLMHRYGYWMVGSMTILLGASFIIFQGRAAGDYAVAIAAAWALGPVLAGVIVWRMGRKDE
ncbi:MAG: hypothetical protein ABJA83_08205 [Burkholderiaceae bacterium]